jgi:hypothetical protein
MSQSSNIEEPHPTDIKGIFTQKTSVALVRERTVPTERPPLADKVNANF